MTTANNDALDMPELARALTGKALDRALKKEKKTAEFMEKLPPKVLKRVEVLKNIQSEHDEIEAKFLAERRALEEKYQKLYQPLYTKRYDIVNGAVEVDGVSNEPVNEGDNKGADKAEEKGVPNFWLTAMKSNEILADSIQEHDEEALKYLKDIKWYRIVVSKDDNFKGEATEGFNLDFFFDPNPYFKNSVLTKTYYMIDEDEPVLERAIGTKIEWIPGKCLTEKVLKKKPKKGSKNPMPIWKTVPAESFFNFFTPPEVPEDEEEIEDDVADELQALMEQDYDIASSIRDKIIPHAVSWFTGEAAMEYGDLDEEDDDEDDDEEDDEEDSDDDGEEDSDEEEDKQDEADHEKKSKIKGTNKRGGETQEGEKPPECKQQ